MAQLHHPIVSTLPPLDLPFSSQERKANTTNRSVSGFDEPQLHPEATADWHAEAGRKGAQRIHQLIQEGRLYEQEHGLKRGRQRLRQLIELGKRYEQEHGLRPAKAGPRRLTRQNSDEALLTLVQSLVRLVKPSVRTRLLTILDALEQGDGTSTEQ